MSNLDPCNYSTKKEYLYQAARKYDNYKEGQEKQKHMEQMNAPKVKYEKKLKNPSEYNIFVQKFVRNNSDLKPRDAMAQAAKAWKNGER